MTQSELVVAGRVHRSVGSPHAKWKEKEKHSYKARAYMTVSEPHRQQGTESYEPATTTAVAAAVVAEGWGSSLRTSSMRRSRSAFSERPP